MRGTIATILTVTAFLTACSHTDKPGDQLTFVLRNHHLRTAREVKAKTSGLREYVVEVFFRVEPTELKAMLPAASFQRDDTVTQGALHGNNSFTELSGMAIPPEMLGFKRTDLPSADGTYCYLVCPPDYSFAYVFYVDAGKS